MTKLTRSEQHIAEKTVCVLLLRGEEKAGQNVYAYVAVRADKIEAFMHAQRKPDFSPNDFGMILESGKGDPSLEVRQRMEKNYGFNHESMVFLDSTL